MRLFLILCTVLSLGSFSACTRAFSQGNTEITAEQLEKSRGRKVTTEEVKEVNERTKKLTEYYNVIRNKKFHFEGEVVDEQGNRLDGIKLYVSTSIYAGLFKETRDETKEYLINGTFDINAGFCLAVSLTFEKDGYYRQTIDSYTFPDLTSKERARIQEKIMKGEPVENPLITKEGLRVVMEKRGETTFLKEYEGVFENNSAGGGTIFDLALAADQAVKKVSILTDKQQIPKEVIYILADKNEQGQIITVNKNKPGNNFPNYIFPKRIRLIVDTDVENMGFILYEPKNTGKPYHQMKKAPENGYKKEIILDDALIEKHPYFFFHINGKYGKGQLRWTQIGNNNSWLKLAVTFYLQPNGSRNLESAFDL